MKALIWVAVSIFIPELVHGESNLYREALLKHPWESVQDYTYVRPGAFMFYWLYYADGTSVGAASKPLIIFIQSGGLAASGIANFAEIGPLTMDMEPRNHTWAKGRNLLLLDDPVGTGFSIARTFGHHPKSDEELVNDLYAALDMFFFRYRAFRTTPTYIFGQGYGGKILPQLAYRLQLAKTLQQMDINLKGIGIGGGFVNMKESILAYPEVLLNASFIDYKTFLETTTIAQRVRDSIDNKDYARGWEWASPILHKHLRQEWNGSINPYKIYKPTINPYNIYKPSPFPALDVLQTKINTYVKPTMPPVVDQKHQWTYVSLTAFHMLGKNVLVPSTKNLEMLLNVNVNGDLKVAIYNGNLDAITPIAGAWTWAHDLRWLWSEEFKQADRHQIRGMNNGFYKEAKKLSFWWVLGAGHWVPEDNPEAMQHILDYLMSNNSVNV